MKRKNLGPVGLIALIGFAANFGGAFANQENDVLTVAAPWKITSLEPTASGTVLQRMGVTEPLTQPDENGQIIGLLADDWHANEDLTVWRFSLKPGVVFHDGSPLTAEIVAANLKKYSDASALRRAPIETISANEGEVVIELSRPFAPLPAYLSHWSTGIVSGATLALQEPTQLHGTGYYKLVEQDGSKGLTLAAFEDYWGKKPQIGDAVYLHVADAGTRYAMVRSGEAELAFGLKANALELPDATADHSVVIEPTPRIRALKLNVGMEPFSDVRIRRALSMAVDRKGIASALLASPDTAATQLLPAVVRTWYQDNLPAFAYDPEAAKSLLADAGWTPGADGILEKDGADLEFEILAYSARPELPEIAAAVQAQFSDIGVKANISNVEWTAIPARHDDKTLETAIVSDGFSYIPEPIGAIARNFTDGGGPWGSMAWHNEAFEKLVDDYQSVADESTRAELRKEMMEILHAEVPLITITWYDETYAISRDIEGFEFDSFEMRYGLNDVTWSSN